MKITIITVARNAADTIADTLSSVASQTWKDIEHIVIDGDSTDSTLEIVSKFPHVAKIVSEKDKGLYFAMNKGLKLSTGDVIGILNADDVYASSDIIEKVIESFLHAKSDVLYGNLVYVNRNDINRVIRLWKPGKLNLSSFYRGWSPPHPTFFVRRKIYEQYGNFNTRFKIASDYELMLRFLLKNRVKAFYLDHLIVKMRTGGISSRSIKIRLIANREDRRAWEVNGLKPHLFTLILKPLTKIKQFLFKWQK
jgi:glycosyltransferase